MEELLSIKKAAAIIGVHPDTLRIWEREGKIKSVRTEGGHRRYKKSDLINHAKPKKEEEKLTVGYCRVSSVSQKEDLKRQVETVSSYCAAKGYQFKIIEDIGSGLNYDKKGLKELIDLIEQNACNRVVVNYKDRLIRFGFELIEHICSIHNVKIEVINQTENESNNEEMVKDVLSVITVYSAKLYGQRSHKNKVIVDTNKELFKQ